MALWKFPNSQYLIISCEKGWFIIMLFICPFIKDPPPPDVPVEQQPHPHPPLPNPSHPPSYPEPVHPVNPLSNIDTSLSEYEVHLNEMYHSKKYYNHVDSWLNKYLEAASCTNENLDEFIESKICCHMGQIVESLSELIDGSYSCQLSIDKLVLVNKFFLDINRMIIIACRGDDDISIDENNSHKTDFRCFNKEDSYSRRLLLSLQKAIGEIWICRNMQQRDIYLRHHLFLTHEIISELWHVYQGYSAYGSVK